MRRYLLACVVLAGVLSVAAGIALYLFPSHSGSLAKASVPSLAPSTSVAAPAVPAAPVQPVLQDVGLFMPKTLDVFTPQGKLNSQKVDIYQGKMTAGADGIHPPAQPAVLTDPNTTLPGTGQGTTFILGHAQSSPQLAFNFLSDLTHADVASGSQVVLTGPSGQRLVYQIDDYQLIDKDNFDAYAKDHFQDKKANRLLIMTCNLDHGKDTLQNRVIIAHLVSSTAGA